MSKHVISAALALACALPLPAFAQGRLSGDVTLASEYISKGAGKSGGDPHASVRLDYGFGETAYAGAWVGNVKTSQGADSEIHLYVGTERQWAGAAFDFRAMYKTLPGTREGVQEDHLEFRADAEKGWGPNKVRLRVEFAPDGYAATEEAWWVESQYSRKLTGKLSAVAAIGVREQNNSSDYTAWNAGLRYAVRDNVGLDLRWFDTDSHGLSENHEGRLVAALAVGF